MNRDPLLNAPNLIATPRRRAGAVLLSGLLMAACATDATDVVRSDIQPAGMDLTVQYDIDAAPDGGAEVNVTRTYGPFAQILETTFTDGSGVKTQEAAIVDGGGYAQAYSMIKPSQSVGITNYLEVEPARYLVRNEAGEEVCGIKVRQQFRRDLSQALNLDGDGKVDFDALWYYTAPCPDEGELDRTVAEQDAELYALVINEQWTPRVSGDPIIINRGHSVTIVGDSPASELPAGWWEHLDTPTEADVKDAADIIKEAVQELDKDENDWLQFGSKSEFADAEVIYSAGDADVYNIERIALNRQTDYVVNYRLPNEDGTYGDFKTVLVRPIYNYEWNDWSQNFEGYVGQLNAMLNDEGQPKEPSDEKLKEIERAGCQNCPNPTLEQIQFINPETGDIQYAFTIRAFKGASETLFMMGPVQPPSLAEAREASGANDQSVVDEQCRAEIRAQEADESIDDDDRLTQQECAQILREGKLWDYLVNDADDYGFDLVGHYSVVDNSTWAPIPCGGESGGTCGYTPISRDFEAAYKLNSPDVEGPLAVLNMLGEVGVRTFGMSYASGKQRGSGIIYAMEQVQLATAFYADGTPHVETPFLLDSRADQLPGTIQRAHEVLSGE